MVSDKVRSILISKGAPFTKEEMEGLSDKEGWAWIYASNPPKQKQKHGLPEICFTGFYGSRKTELQDIAKENGFKCVTDVTKNLCFLCVGDDPGPAKLTKARTQGVPIISEEDFLTRIAGGF